MALPVASGYQPKQVADEAEHSCAGDSARSTGQGSFPLSSYLALSYFRKYIHCIRKFVRRVVWWKKTGYTMRQRETALGERESGDYDSPAQWMR